MAVAQTFWVDADVFNSIERVGWRCSKGAVVPNGQVSMDKASNALKRAMDFSKPEATVEADMAGLPNSGSSTVTY